MEPGTWATLNGAQRLALLAYVPAALYVAWQVLRRAERAGWPLPLTVVWLVTLGLLGALAVTVTLGVAG